MRKTGLCLIIAAMASLASGVNAAASERYEDGLGDAAGNAPDIVAVTLSEPEGPVLSISVELASEPPLSAGEAYSDLLWLVMDTDREVTIPELDGYTITTLGTTLPDELESGGHLLVGQDLYWHVVDIAVDGATVIFRVDRKLLGDPTDLHFRVYSARLSDSLASDETDHYPAPDEPAAVYHLSRVAG